MPQAMDYDRIPRTRLLPAFVVPDVRDRAYTPQDVLDKLQTQCLIQDGAGRGDAGGVMATTASRVSEDSAVSEQDSDVLDPNWRKHGNQPGPTQTELGIKEHPHTSVRGRGTEACSRCGRKATTV